MSCLPQDFKERVRVENVERIIVGVVDHQHVRALNDRLAQLLGREFRVVIGLGRRRLEAPTRERGGAVLQRLPGLLVQIGERQSLISVFEARFLLGSWSWSRQVLPGLFVAT